MTSHGGQHCTSGIYMVHSCGVAAAALWVMVLKTRVSGRVAVMECGGHALFTPLALPLTLLRTVDASKHYVKSTHLRKWSPVAILEAFTDSPNYIREQHATNHKEADA